MSRSLITILLFALFVAPCIACTRTPQCAFQPATADEPAIPEGLGVNLSIDNLRAGELEMLVKGGFRWVRVDFKWDLTEKEKGKYQFEIYDRLVDLLAPFKLRTLFILDYGNPLYDNGAPPRTAAAREAFTRWAIAAATHFANRKLIWELYNEPNNEQFWPPKPNVEEYIALALAVGRAFKASLPNEMLVGPALGEMDFGFLRACFKAGLLEYWSAVTVHPYLRDDPELITSQYCELRELIRAYAPTVIENGVKRTKLVPVFSGEWGYSDTWPGMSVDKQGELLARQWLINSANGISLSIWYDWKDDGNDPRDPEHHFGTVRNAYRAGSELVFDPKPAYKAAKTLANFFSGFKFEKRLEVGGANDYALVFTKGGMRKVAAWTTSKESRTLAIPANPGDYQILAHTGELRATTRSEDKVLKLAVTGAPLYFDLK